MLQPLKVGDHVYIQNLTGNHPKRWERTGVVIEVRQFHQYVVRVDGSGRVTLRNRQHLRKFTPFWPESDRSSSPEIPTIYAPVAQGLGNPHPDRRPPKSSSIVQGLPTPQEDVPAVRSNLSNDKREMGKQCEGPTELDQPLTVSVPVAVPTELDQSPTTPGPIEEAQPQPQPQRQTQRNVPRALARLTPFNKPGRREVT